MEDDERDPFLLEYSSGSKQVRVIKSFGKEKVAAIEEETKEIIESIPGLDLPQRARRSCLCHSGADLQVNQEHHEYA